jgi:PAS domain S-box-containing protein
MEPLIRILYLEDNVADARLAQALLEEAGLACRFTFIQTGEELEETLNQRGYDIILADYRLPMYDGLSALRQVGKMGLDIPFIFVSGTMGEDAAIEALREGATDYVLKQKLSRLVPSVKRALHEAENRRERQRVERSLADQFQFLQLLIDTIPSPIFVKDKEGLYLGCNQSLANFLGMSKADIIGKTVFELYARESAEKYYQMDQELLQTPGTQIYEFLMARRDGVIRNFIFSKATFADSLGKVAGIIGVMTDITERRQAEEERLAHLRFFESMDRVNRAIQRASDIEQMMNDALDVVLSIFNCDRAWLFYPCDPEAPSWQVPMEKTRAGYPGAFSMGVEFPMGEDAAIALRTMLAASGPVKFGPGSENPLPPELAQRFNYQSQILMTLYPRLGKPWVFGLHQCSHPRLWTPEEERLFREVGGRLTDALTSLLSHRNLQESEEKYRLLVSQIPAVAFKGYADGNVDFFDDKIEALTGYAKKDFDSRRVLWPDLIVAEDRPGVRDRLIRALKTNSAWECEYRVHKCSGDLIWIQTLGNISVDGAGRIAFINGVLSDITARKEMEEKLLQAKEEWELTFNAVPHLIAILDTQHRIVRVNRAMAAKLGVAPEEAVGLKCYQMVHETEAPPAFCPHAKLLADGNEHSSEIYDKNLGGYFGVTVSPLRDNQGRLLGSVHVARDITERKQAEQELKKYRDHLEALVAERTAALSESETRFRAIFEGAPLGIGLRDQAGQVVALNPALERILGYTLADYQTLGLSFLHPEDVPQVQSLMSELAAGRRDSFLVESRAFHRDGHKVWGRVHVTKVRGKDDQTWFSLSLIEDITREKETQAEISSYQERLRALAMELILTEERERRRLATDLHDNIGQVLALLQIKLGSLRQGLTSLEMAANLDEARNLLSQIIRSTRSLTMEMGLSVLNELGFASGLEWLGEKFQEQCGFQVEVNCEPLPPCLDLTLRTFLFRAIRELLTNVAKHAQAREVAIEVKTEPGQLVLQVADDGVGFEVSNLTEMAGFGLFSITERLNNLGGHLKIHSDPGKGVRVKLTLPLQVDFPHNID